MTPAAKSELVRALATEVGFDLVGVTMARPLPGAGYYRDWLAAGHGAQMHYLRRHVQLRADPRLLLPGARSVICAGLNYRRSDGHRRADVAQPTDRPPGEPGPVGRVAQYARGRDYHIVVRGLLAELVARLRARLGTPFEARVLVDTGPVLERELAAAAGLGWIGKNTCLLNDRFGSYLLLGEAITTLELEADGPVGARCATCRRCLDACPTGALRGPHVLDASRCISYLTIEHRGVISSEFHEAMADWVFGCDICQQVCPYNARGPLTGNAEIAADVVPRSLSLLRLLALRSGEYRRLTAGSAARRARAEMWRRNAAIALGNARLRRPEILEALRAAAAANQDAVSAAAAYSLVRLAAY